MNEINKISFVHYDSGMFWVPLLSAFQEIGFIKCTVCNLLGLYRVNEVGLYGSDNGLAPVWRRAITWTNTALLSARSQSQWQMNINTGCFIQQNEFQNAVCKMSAIF